VTGAFTRLREHVPEASDGILTSAGICEGFAGAGVGPRVLLFAGFAGLVAGTLAMGAVEYSKLRAGHDRQAAQLGAERARLQAAPAAELDELTGLYVARGLSPALARQVAVELTAHDALAAHAEAELGIDPTERTNPWHAAGSSMLAFSVGALLPLVAIVLPPQSWRVPVTFVAVLAALVVTGVVSARLGGAPARAAVVRNVVVGLLAMVVTFAVGSLFSVGG
jgi:VIT1/CCC1 family predicted Fe2+/Mn2+ transporter